MRIKLSSILFIISFLSACNDNDTKTYNISGKVQKGPFQIGSDITLIELDNSFNPTGRTFFSTIIDNEGRFEFPEVEFSSNYIEIKAEGSFYDESVGVYWPDEISLYALSNLTNPKTINVNLLTHIQRERIKSLCKEGLSYETSVEKSQKELLAVFNFENFNLDNFPNLDFTINGEGGNILLVITMIIATHNWALQEFLTQFSVDFKDNGKIDSENTQNILANIARFLSPEKIVTNLNNFYNQNQAGIDVAEIRSLIDTFLINSDFKSTVDFSFPASTSNGINLLCQNDTIIIADQRDYSISINIAGNLANYGATVELTKLSGTGGWSVSSESTYWIFDTTYNRLCLSLGYLPGITADKKISFYGSGVANLSFVLETCFGISYCCCKEFTKKIYWDCK